jgi:F-box/WD-40 domain protein 7
VTCLYFDQEQDLIVSGSLDYDIRFWQLSTGDCCQKIDWISKEGHRGVIRTLKADSWRVVSGADDKTIKVRKFLEGFLIKKVFRFGIYEQVFDYVH